MHCLVALQTTLLFDEIVKREPDAIHCAEEKPPLNQVLKINVNDPKSGHLRIPKRNKRPADVLLASGYTSKATIINEILFQVLKIFRSFTAIRRCNHKS